MERKIKDTITSYICEANLWWDRKIDLKWGFAIAVVLVAVVVMGVTADNIKAKTATFIFLGVFFLFRLYGTRMNRKLNKN